MGLEIKVPAVGESITEVTLSQWLKKDGDYVEMDENLAELESDKATFELPAEKAGMLHIIAKEGDTLEIGAVVCTIEEAAGNGKGAQPESGNAKADTRSAAPQESAPKAEPVDIKVPTVGESITEVTLSQWLKKDGDYVEMDEDLAELESDKATFELPAEVAGTLQIVAQEGDTLPIGAVVCKIVPSGKGASAIGASKSVAAMETSVQEETKSVNYASGTPSPAAAKILKEKGIDTNGIVGTGKDGRITKEDALKAEQKPAEVKAVPAKAEAATAPKTAPAIQKSSAGSRNERREKMSSLRKTIAKRLVSVKNETAMLTTFNEVDMKPIMDLRAKYKDKFKEKYGIGLGFMSFFTKAVTTALAEWPAVNARIEDNEIVYSDFADVSIAVSAPKGLVVPVIRNAESMSLDEIELAIKELATKARDNKLTIEEMTGGTFTITNGGVFGSMMSTPIINAPQSAILGMHNIVERPIALNGQVVIRPMMYIALSYDHRIVDGRESVSFLVRVKELLEDPARLLLGI